MAERYWISGAQIGVLKAPLADERRKKILKKIEDNQFIGRIDEEKEIIILKKGFLKDLVHSGLLASDLVQALFQGEKITIRKEKTKKNDS